MRTKKLDIRFSITGDGLHSCAVEPPLSVDNALKCNGLLADRFSGMGALECEWADNRSFAFDGAFSLDDWNCERTYIIFEWLRGNGRIFLNGSPVAGFSGGRLALDVTEFIRPGANALRIEFAPGRDRGISGGIMISGCWNLHIRSFALDRRADGLAACATVSAHTAGRYRFCYAVALNDVAVKTFEYEEALGARTAVLSHELPLEAVSGADSGTPAIYRTKLTVTRSGQTCDECAGFIAGCDNAAAPHAVCMNNTGACAEQLNMLLDAGVRRFFVDADTFLSEEFLRRADECGAEICLPESALTPGAPQYACLRTAEPPATVQSFAGMRRFADTGRAIPEIALRALGGGQFIDAAQELLPVMLPFADMPRAAALLRFLQAQRIAGAIEAAQSAGGDIVPDISEPAGMAFSGGLFDDGQPRPAYFALRAAWRDCGVYALLDGYTYAPGAPVSAPVYVRGTQLSAIKAELYDAQGKLLSRAGFESGAGSQRVGEIMFTLGGDCAAYLLRLSANTPHGAIVRDYPLCVRGDNAMSAFAALDTVRIKCTDGVYENMDRHIAFGTQRPDGGCALLPGERAELCSPEGINVYSYSELGTRE